MKRLLTIILFLALAVRSYAPGYSALTIFASEPFHRLFTPQEVSEAIIWVETGNNGSGAYNRIEPQAKGIFQQWPIFVDDVNRILGYKKFAYSDRLISSRAKAMFWIYQKHYNPSLDFEIMCRLQCGGPDGPEQSCTDNYLELVKQKLYND
jgi:hypothetical protein